MAQRSVDAISADELWREWRQDLEKIKREIHELFSARRAFREVADVFGGNHRLQSVGWRLWDWMRVNYAAFVIIRIRRETDDQSKQ